MTREEEVQFKQDRLGNERRELDTLRAQEGMVGEDGSEGIKQVVSADTSSVVLVQEKPTHADRMFVDLVHAHNSASTAGDRFSLFEATTNENGSIISSTRRSVPYNVSEGATREVGYEGKEFTGDIAVESEFQGQVGVAFYSDHEEYEEPAVNDN